MATIGFDKRVAVVTGAGSGLGRTYARELARRGAAVVVNDLGGSYEGHGASAAPAGAVVAEIEQSGGRAIASYDSVASPEGAARIAKAAVDAFGRLDIVINNAGILRNAFLRDLPNDDLDALIDVHLKGAFYVTRAAMPMMAENGYGRVLFTSSGSGIYGCQTQAAYGAAKAALLGLMNVVALEGASDGILANTLMPVAAETRMAGEMSEEQMAAFRRLFAPYGKAVTPDFVTPLAVYLVSEACTATKHIYSASGGRFARVFIGTGQGWYGPRDAPATAEDIATHFEEIDSPTNWREVEDLLDEAVGIGRHIMDERPTSEERPADAPQGQFDQ